MNYDRRKQIRNVSLDLDKIKSEIDAKTADEQTGEGGTSEELAGFEENWLSRVDDMRSDLAEVKGDEQETYDNMPEGLQGGERGQLCEDAISAMEDALEEMDELLNVTETGEFVKLFHQKYDGIISKLEDAQA